MLPELIAHRGNAAEFPENTLPALRSALELGVNNVEFDVQLSADLVPVLLHDVNLQRTVAVDRDVGELDWAEIAELRASEVMRFGERYPDVAVPSLAQAVELLGGYEDSTAFVEIKRASLRRFGTDAVVGRVVEVLRPIMSRCVIISFDLTAVHLAKNSFRCRAGWVVQDLSSLTALKCEALAPEFLFCDQELLPDDGSRLWRGPWRWALYEVTSAAQALELARRGAALAETMQVRSLLRGYRELGALS